ncbi:protein FAR1-RELATED SEQUENCE 9-like isoform X1 [Panicum virgatum]|uniref:protein FAR1-RELATED SEQUENCE 9-like isoform X1 n=2 Tax=Panicum virgatum TaxID=38727 RepID=UPI0019D69DBA|nr:protein FAR1-RELATED SEQUENCE 9-like isoform X1 [Panicum virgatum]XP_039771614.1 protein FAR1-RELATED SEQUENCE 9-like isoform X1 [Panicum virgatum]XP_039771615.1 protein FAR1-RELATED SEQUENCE 9-like isoform X1 [Panicum virgatum]
MDLHAVETSKKKMERGAESSPMLPAQTMAERNLKSYQEMSDANGELGMRQGNEPANGEPCGLVASAMNKVHETRKEAEEEADMPMVEMENTSRGDTDLEERYGIILAPEHEVREHGNLTSQESLESPVFLWNDTEMNRQSEIQVLGAGETFVQELGQENGNVVLNEGDEDLNECQKDQADAEADGDEDYMFPSPEEMEKARPPEVGMVFSTLQDAHRFISVYGQVTGFAVIKGTNYKHKKITFVCNKSRKARETDTRQRKRRRDAVEHTQCRMKVTVKLVADRWEVTAAMNEHNHPLWCSPLLTRFFMSHKDMSDEERHFSRILQESRIKPAKIMEIFRKLQGRFKNVPVRKVDVNSLKQSGRLMKARNTDIGSTLEHVRRLQKEQPGFYYALRTDEDSTIRSIFWTDARARLGYALYGDFIHFNTTYRTNAHHMPFASLIGINGHGKPTVFGWALLENDEAETFSWLFRTFLDVMDGKKPSIVITHQDSAILKSIAEVFPAVFHRFSMWHVVREAAAEVEGFMVNRPGMEAELTRLITNSLTTEEFENGWKGMLEKYTAELNEHLKHMYWTRSMWVPVYFKHVFCPFMRSFGHCESTYSIFQDYVLQEDTIETFISQYNIFQYEAVSIDRFESTLQKPIYCTRQLIERRAAEIYTMGLFLKFQKELLDASAFNVFEKEKDTLYTVQRVVDYEDAEFPNDSFTIEVDMKIKTFNCICSKFERDGILCCHVLRLFTQFGINEIPEHYIKQRWTKKFREQELQKLCIEKTQNSLRYAMLMNRMAETCASVSKDPSQSQIFLEELERIQQKMSSRA